MASSLDRERAVLRKARSFLVRNMGSPARVVDFLISGEVLDEEDEQHIHAARTDNDRIRELLHCLAKKPPGALARLEAALRAEDQGSTAAYLNDLWRNYEAPDGGPREDAAGRGGTPPAPANFVERPEETEQVVTAVLALARRPGWALVHGMGGIGKTVLVARAVREAFRERPEDFPGGVVWYRVGRLGDKDDLLQKLNTLLLRLDPGRAGAAPITNPEAAKELLRATTERREKTLLVLDNFWDGRWVKWFNFGGRVLATSRQAELLARLPEVLAKVPLRQGFSPAQSKAMFARALNQDVAQLPAEAEELQERCEGLPLAVALLSGLLKRHPRRWAYYAEALRTGHVERVAQPLTDEEEHDSLDRAIGCSVDNLPADQRDAFHQLAVFQRGVLLSARVLAVLWDMRFEEEAVDMLDALAFESLVCQEGEGLYSLHDLLHIYLVRHSDQRQLHQLFLERYRARCPDHDLCRLPSDGYILSFVGWHLSHAGQGPELVRLLTSLEFAAAKVSESGPTELVRDFAAYEGLFAGKEEELAAFRGFVQRNASFLPAGDSRERLLARLVQLGLCNPPDGPVFAQAQTLAGKLSAPGQPFWIWRNSSAMPCNLKLKVQVRNTFIHSVDVNDLGSRLLVSNHDGDVVVLDAHTGHELCHCRPDDSEVYRAAFIGGEAACFVCCSDSGFIRLFELPAIARMDRARRPSADATPAGPDTDWPRPRSTTGSPRARRTSHDLTSPSVLAVFPEAGGMRFNYVPRCCSIHADRIFVGCQDGTVARFTVQRLASQKGERDQWSIFLASERKFHDDAVMAVAVSACGGFVLSAGSDRRARVFNQEEFEFLPDYRGHSAGLIACLFVPGGGETLRAVTAAANEIHVWRTEDASFESQFTESGSVNYTCLALSKDAHYLAAGLNNGLIKLWRFNSPELEALHEFAGHHGNPLSLCFDRHRERLFSTGDDALLHTWDLSCGSSVYRQLSADRLQLRPVVTVHWGAARTLVAGQDLHSNAVILLDAADGRRLHSDRPLPWRASEMAFTGDGRRLAVGSELGDVCQYRIAEPAGPEDQGPSMAPAGTARCAGDGPHKAEEQAVTCLRYVCGESALAAGLYSGRIWVLSEGGTRVLEGHQGRVSALVELFTPRHCLLSASFDGTVRLWPLEGDADPVGEVLCRIENSSIYCVDVQPERGWLLTTSSDKVATVWSLESGDCVHRMSGHGECVRVGAFSPFEADLVATADDNGLVLVWRVGAEKPLASLPRPAGHSERWVTALLWSERDLLLTASGGVQAWSVSAAALRQTFYPSGNEVNRVSARPDTGDLVVVDSAGILYILDRFRPPRS